MVILFQQALVKVFDQEPSEKVCPGYDADMRECHHL